MSSMIEMSLEGVMYDVLKRPIVVLRKDDRVLPILVGGPEAFAIQNGLEKVAMPRPMTHDLITYILTGFGAKVQAVQVYKLDQGTFYAHLLLTVDGGSQTATGEQNLIKIDCRPSDAMAVAVRVGCPIYVADKVLDAAGQEQSAEGEDDLDIGDEPTFE